MAIQSYALSSQRIGRLKGEILAHAVAVEVLGITGMQRQIPKNSGDTVVYRRWLPYGGTSGAVSGGIDPQDRFFANNTTVDRSAAMVSAHLTAEGVTPAAETLSPVDVTVALQQYTVLYGLTDKTVDLYEDDVAAEMKKQTGERVGLLREMVRYGALTGCTNVFYSGGASRAAISGKLTINLLRKISRSLQGNHARRITSVLAPSANFATAPVEAAYLVFSSSDLESDIRDIPGFIPVVSYGNRKPINENEIGAVENFRFITSPELVAIQDAATSTTASAYGLLTTTGTNPDVYRVIVAAEDAWGQVALRGGDALDPSYIPPGQKDKNDPLGQRGYIGAKFYMNATVLNNGWMAIAEVGASAL